MEPRPEHLRSTAIIDSDHEAVREFAFRHAGSSSNQTDQAVRLYYAVRDGIRYNPYLFDLTVDGLKASTTLEAGESWCVPKAALLAACCRVLGMPTQVGFADVRNHLSTERMREKMKTDIFHWHGYTSIYLNRKWVKATPAFNLELCEKFRLKPLEFNGQEDSIFHSWDLDGHRHMEYLHFRGDYDDVPLEEMRESFAEILGSLEPSLKDADFHLDVEKETEGQ